ncbi:hypothetical protein VE02_00483 [Pseudogymnoascus sp. 03VT05]|nr:hypothetical protein VE02_00483 [Pseudogymnoascus sp. 03VT05]
MRSQPASGYPIIRRLRSVCDRQWTHPLPVGVFLIRHPEGLFLFDTGQSPCCNDAGYFPRAALFNKMLSNFTIEPSDGIVQLLSRQGVKPTDLKAVILSHLHNDHAGGLEDLVAAAPDLPVYPKIIDYEDRPVGPWKKSYPLTSDGKIVAVDTSGHVAGHLAHLVFGESGTGVATTYILPGDATYGIDVLDKEEPDGINDDPVRALQSLRLIKEFARQTDVVVLPSHDTDTPRFLAKGVVYRPK